MKAVVYRRYGSPDRLRLRDVEKPVPKHNEVLVRVHAASVNSWDWDLLTGRALVRIEGPFRPKYEILGADIAGVVETVGKDVTRFHPGEAVFGDLSESGWGGFAEYATIDAGLLAAKPDELSYVEAAAIPQAGSLALQGLGKRPIGPGDQVLINGAGGGVGSFAVQIAKHLGAEVTAVDHTSKFEFVHTLGADHFIDYTLEDYTGTGDRYDLILDMVADRSMFAYARALNPGGAFVMVGGSIRALLRCVSVGATITATSDKSFRILPWRPRRADFEELGALAVAGTVRPAIDRTYKLANAAEALQQIGDGEVKGKVVISMMAAST
ncbi:MAG: NAD(P)-dependent alcohol dehydrogenase [Alphaproteobacteria bacterium]